MPYSALRGDDVMGPDLEAIRDLNGKTQVAGPGWPTCDQWWNSDDGGPRSVCLAI